MGDQQGGAREVGEVPAQLGAVCSRVRASRAASGSSSRSTRGRRRARGPGRPAGPGRPRAARPGPASSARPTRSSQPAACPGPRCRRRRGPPEGDVVQRAQVRKEQVVLEDHADRPLVRRRDRSARPGRPGRRRPTAILPGVERREPGQGPQGGGLAGAVRAEQRDHLAGRSAPSRVAAVRARAPRSRPPEPVATRGRRALGYHRLIQRSRSGQDGDRDREQHHRSSMAASRSVSRAR